MKVPKRTATCHRFLAPVLGALLCAMATVALAADEAVVVVNSGVSDSSLTSQQIQDAFLGKKTTWSDGSKITLGTLSAGETHEKFLQTCVQKTDSQFSIYWKKLVFAGKAMEPKAFATEEELLKFVAATKGAIGYVSATTAANTAAMTGCKALGK